jgi:hypothetical protein
MVILKEKDTAMTSIPSKLSMITLALAAMTFAFALGTISSKAVSDEASFGDCVSGIMLPYPFRDKGGAGRNFDAIQAILQCAP